MLTKTEQARFNMIQQQIRPAEVLDQRVLDTFTEIPRERFVPDEYQGLAFSDTNVKLSPHKAHGEIMMKPIMEARLLQALDVQPDDEILEIGTGSGYFTALLAKLGRHVTSVEIDPELQARAGTVLGKLGIDNVSLLQGDGAQGWPTGGPFDVIAITGSMASLPEAFLQQLKIGGRLVVIVGTSPVMEARLVTHAGENQWITEVLFETDFPPLRNAEPRKQFVF